MSARSLALRWHVQSKSVIQRQMFVAVPHLNLRPEGAFKSRQWHACAKSLMHHEVECELSVASNWHGRRNLMILTEVVV
jgi:hypothetical protein